MSYFGWYYACTAEKGAEIHAEILQQGQFRDARLWFQMRFQTGMMATCPHCLTYDNGLWPGAQTHTPHRSACGGAI